MSPRSPTSRSLFHAAQTLASPVHTPLIARQSSSDASPERPSPTLPTPQKLSTSRSIPLHRPLDKTPRPDIPIQAVPPARTPSSSSLQSGTAPLRSKYQTTLPVLSAPPPSFRNR